MGQAAGTSLQTGLSMVASRRLVSVSSIPKTQVANRSTNSPSEMQELCSDATPGIPIQAGFYCFALISNMNTSSSRFTLTDPPVERWGSDESGHVMSGSRYEDGAGDRESVRWAWDRDADLVRCQRFRSSRGKMLWRRGSRRNWIEIRITHLKNIKARVPCLYVPFAAVALPCHHPNWVACVWPSNNHLKTFSALTCISGVLGCVKI